MTEDVLRPDEFSFFVPCLLQAWFTFVPCGVRAPDLDLDSIADGIDALNGQLSKGGDLAVDALTNLAEASRQPGVLTVLMAQLLDGKDKMPKAQRPSPTGTLMILVLLRVVVDELDRMLRR